MPETKKGLLQKIGKSKSGLAGKGMLVRPLFWYILHGN